MHRTKTRWDAWGCAWKSHWEETTLCLQTSIQPLRLFQQMLQAFAAPYWRDRGGQPAICVSFSVLALVMVVMLWAVDIPPNLAYSKILKYYFRELCSGLFVILPVTIRLCFITKRLFLNDPCQQRSRYFAVGEGQSSAVCRNGLQQDDAFYLVFRDLEHLDWQPLAARCFHPDCVDGWDEAAVSLKHNGMIQRPCAENQKKQTKTDSSQAQFCMEITLNTFTSQYYGLFDCNEAYKWVKWLNLGCRQKHYGFLNLGMKRTFIPCRSESKTYNHLKVIIALILYLMTAYPVEITFWRYFNT